jgi:hypothetical protein
MLLTTGRRIMGWGLGMRRSVAAAPQVEQAGAMQDSAAISSALEHASHGASSTMELYAISVARSGAVQTCDAGLHVSAVSQLLAAAVCWSTSTPQHRVVLPCLPGAAACYEVAGNPPECLSREAR